MLQKELKVVLEKHKKWLNNEQGGECANLSGANLSDADLSDADLTGADLSGANLSCADLNDANLTGADLSGADIMRANLSDANLTSADLSDADLSDAYLRSANLTGANLTGANLSDANLRSANLSGANLSGADLRRADLNWANLSGANLRSAKNLEIVYYNELTAMFAANCPEKGSFTAFKKLQNDIIAELFVPAKASRSSATTRKCRASEAKIIRMWNYKTQEVVTKALSQHDDSFVYETGKTVKPTTPFNEDRWNECASGIHFFITQKEAENY